MVLADKEPEKDETQIAAGVPQKKVISGRCSVFGKASRGREPTGAGTGGADYQTGFCGQ